MIAVTAPNVRFNDETYHQILTPSVTTTFHSKNTGVRLFHGQELVCPSIIKTEVTTTEVPTTEVMANRITDDYNRWKQITCGVINTHQIQIQPQKWEYYPQDHHHISPISLIPV